MTNDTLIRSANPGRKDKTMKHAHIKYIAILAVTHSYPLDWFRRDISVAIQAGMINVGIGRRLLRTAKIMRNERVIY